MNSYNEYYFNPNTIQTPDIEKLKQSISQYFSVYDVRWNERTAAFYVSLPNNADLLDENFENLRIKLKTDGLIPRLAVERGENIIYIVQAPVVKKRSIWINVILIILTIFTTTWAGALLWYGRSMVIENEFDIITPLLIPESVIFGFLSFALPLMLILGTHETAHYLAAKRHNIDASLPYFIPLPPPFILGTMGAFISMREPISNKKALLDIGAAGPIAGFLVSIPVLIIGFTLESLYPVELTELPSNVFIFNEPLLFAGLRVFFPSPENSLMHPTTFAGWVGLFVTALNLLPGGQLDGGHIARALLGENARYLSLMVVISLFILSFITQFMLWIIFAFFILLLGTAHPPPLNDLTPLGIKRQTVGALCMVMLLLCIHYAPITNVSIPQYEFEFQCENSNQVVDINGTAVYLIEVTNTENEGGRVKFYYEAYSLNTNLSDWKTETQLRNSKGEIITDIDDFELKEKESFYIKLNVTPNQNIGYGGKIFHHINVTISGITEHTDSYTIKTHVGTFDLNRPTNQRKVGAGDIGRFDITIENLLDVNDSIQLTYNITSPEITKDFNWTVSLTSPVIQIGPREFKTIYLNVTTPFDAMPGDEVEIELKGTSQLNPKAYDALNLIVRIIKI